MRQFITILICWTSVVFSAPTVIGVFGGENCPWSKQLRTEVWESSAFRAGLDASQVMVREERRDEPQTPVLILEENGKEIGRLGFLMIPPEKYAALFKEMVSIHDLCRNLNKLSVPQLLLFYRKTQVLNMKACEMQILEQGLRIDQGTDFLLESYAKLCKKHPRRAQKIKTEIRKRSPDNAEVEWQLALISFQAKHESGADPNVAALPLEKYLKRWGDQYPENSWRCHLILAEFFKEKNVPEKAAQYLALAVAQAPADLEGLLPDE